MDVKCGAGAFMKTRADTPQAGRVAGGDRAGQRRADRGAAHGDGRAAGPRRRQRPGGHRVHSRRSKGAGRRTWRNLSVLLAARMVHLAGAAASLRKPRRRSAKRYRPAGGWRSARGDRAAGRRPARGGRLLASCRRRRTATSSRRTGPVPATGFDAERVGRATVVLGAGRDRVEDGVDPAVGVVLRANPATRSRRATASWNCTTATRPG